MALLILWRILEYPQHKGEDLEGIHRSQRQHLVHVIHQRLIRKSDAQKYFHYYQHYI